LPNTKIILQTVLLLLLLGAFHVAFAGPVEVQSIHIAPAETKIGIYPDITGSIKVNNGNGPGNTVELTVIAVVFRPDHVMKSWVWKNVTMKAGEVRLFIIPKEYAVTLAGSYKVDFNVYTEDMRPLHRLSNVFVATDSSLQSDKTVTRITGTSPAATFQGSVSKEKAHYHHIGVGIYGDTLNLTGGATILLWPFKSVGLQGTFTGGRFTTVEGRLIARYTLSAGVNPYVGIGYLTVSTERTVDVIGSKEKFRDSGASGVVGLEIPLTRSLHGYAEISGAAIDLKKEVVNGASSGTAAVKYSQVTAGAGIVYYLY
jgi:hypothetical protein